MTMALMTMLVMLVIMTASVFIVQSTPDCVKYDRRLTRG